jgi:glycine/D-amino acid oxidase-like deaminating enzyme
MMHSYWEIQSWLNDVDFTIVGSGIVGLNCALQLRHMHPHASIRILERGVLPQGASTKNAGFACFGSLSEILDDLQSHTEQEVYELVQQRLSGLQFLRETLGDHAIDYKPLGGFELFLNEDQLRFQECLDNLELVNQLLAPLFKEPVFSIVANRFHFKGVHPQYVFNKFEAQLDTGKMMLALLKKAWENDIIILNNCELKSFIEEDNMVHLQTRDFEFHTKHLLIATNGFAQQLLDEDIKPARAQVLVTEPIPNLPIKGTFHMDQGYYYFRNIRNRILLGGGRNLDFLAEETTEFGETELIQQRLEQLLREVILPETDFKIAQRWSGIMGVGPQKKPIIKQLSQRVYCGIRLGGMGVAIGSKVGKELADLTL